MSRLKDLRIKRGYTQIKMQQLTGIDQSDYSKIENGKRYYTFEQCRRIALALNTSMDYLSGITDIEEPYPRNNAVKILKFQIIRFIITKKQAYFMLISNP